MTAKKAVPPSSEIPLPVKRRAPAPAKPAEGPAPKPKPIPKAAPKPIQEPAPRPESYRFARVVQGYNGNFNHPFLLLCRDGDPSRQAIAKIDGNRDYSLISITVPLAEWVPDAPDPATLSVAQIKDVLADTFGGFLRAKGWEPAPEKGANWWRRSKRPSVAEGIDKLVKGVAAEVKRQRTEGEDLRAWSAQREASVFQSIVPGEVDITNDEV